MSPIKKPLGVLPCFDPKGFLLINSSHTTVLWSFRDRTVPHRVTVLELTPCLVICHLSFVICHLLLVTGQWSLKKLMTLFETLISLFRAVTPISV